MLNYAVDRAVLEPLVPAGTVLDTYKGVAYVSVVGFLFLRTRLLGVPIPGHQDFEEVNLRFYVRRFGGDEWRRGVVFLKEIVPRPAIAAVARTVYNEKYVSLPMRHEVRLNPDGTAAAVGYEWCRQGAWEKVHATAGGAPRESAPGSLEEFITEHYWGYVRQRDGTTVEYRVEHPRWRVAPVEPTACGLAADVAALYGDAYAAALAQPPRSAFIAEGSPVTVYRGQRLPGR